MADDTVDVVVEPVDTEGGWFQFYWTLPDVTAWLGVLGVIVFSVGFYFTRRRVQHQR